MTQLLQRGEAAYASVPRIDALERATGRAKYAADWKRKDMLYARIIQSKVPNGRVVGIDKPVASGMEGVVDMVTCFDDKTVWHAGEREHERRLFTERVRFIGDCIGAVAAESRMAAQRCCEEVSVRYEEYPATFTIESSLREGAPKVWEDGNVLSARTYGFGDVEEAFGACSIAVEGEYETARVHNSQLETAASLAWWEGGRLTVVAATQSLFGCRNGIARDLGIPADNVRVITRYKGGGFGNKADSMNYDLIAAILARRTGRPVMVEYSRSDEFTSVHGRWSSRQKLRLGCDPAGNVLAMEVKAMCDIGAYTRRIKPFNFVDGAQSYYSCRAFRGEDAGVYTNTPATGHMRAPSGPQSCFASETIMDEAALRLGIDPLEFRLRNMVRVAHNSETLTSNGLEECLRAGAEAFRWKERRHRGGVAGEISKGAGVAIAAWHSRLGRGEASVSLTRDGRIVVRTGVVDIGTGAKTTMAIIASRNTDMPLESVDLEWGDTEGSPFSVGESGSRTTAFTGTAVRAASAALRGRILERASAIAGIDPSRLEIRKGAVLNAGRRLFSVEDVAETLEGDLVEKAATEPRLPEGAERLSFAAHFAEVEVDMETGAVKVTKYVAAHDSGPIVNRLTAASQVQGGVIMGMGMALTEQLLISDYDGSLLNGSFMLYRLPNIKQTPDIQAIFINTDDPFGPKSLGEITLVPVAAAIGNAIFNATGVRLRQIPFTPERVAAGIERERASPAPAAR